MRQEQRTVPVVLPTGQEVQISPQELTPDTISNLVAQVGTATFVVKDENGNILTPSDIAAGVTLRRVIIEEYNEAKDV